LAKNLRSVTDKLSQVTFLVEDALLGQVEEIRNALAHSHPNMSIKEVFAYSLGEVVKKIRRPKESKKKSPPAPSTSAVEVKKALPSRYIAVEVKRQVWKRDGGRCTYRYRDPTTGRACSSKYGL